MVDHWPEFEVAARYVTTVRNVIDISVERAPTEDVLVLLTDGGVTVRLALAA